MSEAKHSDDVPAVGESERCYRTGCTFRAVTSGLCRGHLEDLVARKDAQAAEAVQRWRADHGLPPIAAKNETNRPASAPAATEEPRRERKRTVAKRQSKTQLDYTGPLPPDRCRRKDDFPAKSGCLKHRNHKGRCVVRVLPATAFDGHPAAKPAPGPAASAAEVGQVQGPVEVLGLLEAVFQGLRLPAAFTSFDGRPVVLCGDQAIVIHRDNSVARLVEEAL